MLAPIFTRFLFALCSVALVVTQAQAQREPKVYDKSVDAVEVVFPDAAKPGSALHQRMTEMRRELERNGKSQAADTPTDILVAIRAAAALQRERPEAAPNANAVAARSLELVEKVYGNLSDPASAFARAFWDFVPKVRAQVPEYDLSGAWPLAAGALAELKLAGGGGAGSAQNFAPHLDWMAATGRTEWPPKEGPPNDGGRSYAFTRTGTDMWQGENGLTIIRTASGQYRVRR